MSMSHKGNTLLLMALPIHELTSNIYMLVLESTHIIEAIIIGRSDRPHRRLGCHVLQTRK